MPIRCEDLLENLLLYVKQMTEVITPIRIAHIAETLLFFDPRCLWCYRTKAHLNPSPLISCEVCNVAAYCSEEHKENAKAAHKGQTDEAGQTEVCCIVKLCLSDDWLILYFSVISCECACWTRPLKGILPITHSLSNANISKNLKL